MYEAAGFANVATYVQSGNVVFDGAEKKLENVIGMIESAIAEMIGYSVTVILRTKRDFARIVAGNPFAEQHDAAKLHVTFLAQSPAADQLAVPDNCGDEFALRGREVYLHCPNGYARTKLSNNYLEKRLGTAATTRNWKTVLALYALANDQS